VGAEQLTRVVVIAAAESLYDARGIPTPSGSGTGHPVSVHRIRAYAKAV